MSEHQHGHPDTSHGWCCDGKTYTEATAGGGECCQPRGTKLEDLPAEAQELARKHLTEVAVTE